MMKLKSLSAIAVAALMAGCAASPELVSCLNPNRRVVVEVGGQKIYPPKKAGTKPRRVNALHKANVQGFDAGSAVLKADGKKEIDKLVNLVNKGTRRDKTPTKVNSVVVTGHTDRVEADDGMAGLDEERAKSVMNYLVSKGIDKKLIFWEGKDAKDPVAVTRFCPES